VLGCIPRATIAEAAAGLLRNSMNAATGADLATADGMPTVMPA
jgi:hypothetical protein